MTIRVLIADDQQLVRAGLRGLLELDPEIQVVAEAEDGLVALRLTTEHRPDVALVDIRMPELDGLALTRQISADPRLADVRVIVLTTFEIDQYIFEALKAGAKGFLTKTVSRTELCGAVRVVAAGAALLSPSVTEKVIAEFSRRPDPARSSPERLSQLTVREREVLGMIATGRSNSEIGEALRMSPLTAKTHVSRIITKLGVRDRAQLVMIAYETGLVLPGTSENPTG
ncbi:DNA-binding response regulator, NarL/FixJ family, contains REC and HTH domains [Micromonospora phaseoli]|uniref:DNA-binding response regulator, NarL/FixJ family, contains REC and HTH domains n=1 Tax=Micromonospora phaseoli TaxID=1144548 RepID=A0A1H6UU07_9ACTN|nr:response regulator transcription factor [Micromonospora phaseoli]PZV99154.1 LuxR family two component transcriptional regulator [Micromonospora phaseoli]GIJ78644.1 DNA-binding response regulator [Micromonospora phaseoli]SEI95701.1 DNA-binding response regulator, NarL/FixJ family, contains REC and HTH domains [Micromonospora phaseoli]